MKPLAFALATKGSPWPLEGTLWRVDPKGHITYHPTPWSPSLGAFGMIKGLELGSMAEPYTTHSCLGVMGTMERDTLRGAHELLCPLVLGPHSPTTLERTTSPLGPTPHNVCPPCGQHLLHLPWWLSRGWHGVLLCWYHSPLPLEAPLPLPLPTILTQASFSTSLALST